LPKNKKTGNKFVGKITIFPDCQANSAGGMENGRRHAKSQLPQTLFLPGLFIPPVWNKSSPCYIFLPCTA
jgi:hypothetical protein